MNKRTIIAFAIAMTLTFGVTAFWSAQTDERDGDTAANVIESNGSPTGKAGDEKKKGGSRIAKLFTAPVRAFNRIFGRGRGDNKPQRLSEKDVERFESAGAMRVTDARDAETAHGQKGSVTARDYLERGRTLLNAGSASAAITELSRAVSLDPKLTEANNLLGLAYDRKGMHERAKEFYESGVRAQPQDAQALNNLGFSFYLSGNYRAAVDRLKKAAKLAPGDQRILNNLALAQCRLGKYGDAFKSFARAGGELTGRLNTATMLERAGRNDEAITYYEAARRLDPANRTALSRLADLYARANREADAQTAHQSLARLGDGKPTALAQAGR